MKSPARFLSDANTNDRIPHHRLVMEAKGSVPAHATLARYSLLLVAQFVEITKTEGSEREVHFSQHEEQIYHRPYLSVSLLRFVKDAARFLSVSHAKKR